MILSIHNLQTLSNVDLKRLLNEYISLDDIYDECDDCGRPILLHLNPSEPCTTYVDESQEVVAKNLEGVTETPEANFEGH